MSKFKYQVIIQPPTVRQVLGNEKMDQLHEILDTLLAQDIELDLTFKKIANAQIFDPQVPS